MADRPTIRLTAEDRTKAAFASATRNLELFNARAEGIGATLTNIASFGRAGGTLLAFGAAAIATGGGMALAAKSAIDLADNLNDVSKRTGLSVENLSGLQIAAESSGTSLEAVAKGIKTLQVGLVEAKAGTGENVELFRQLGITGLSAQEAFLKLSDTFIQVSDADERAALAVRLFKKNGAELIPLLLEGSDKLRNFAVEGERLSGITTKLAQESDQFKDNMRLLSAAVTGVGSAIANVVLEPLNKFIEQLLVGQKIAGGFFAALKLLGTSKPLSTENLQAYEQELANLQKRLDSLPSTITLPKLEGSLLPIPIPNLDAQKTGIKERIEELKKLIEFQKLGVEQETKKLADAFGTEKKIKGPKLDFGKPEKVGKTLADQLAEDIARAKDEIAKLQFFSDNFDEFGSAADKSAEALARFKVTAGEFKGVKGAEDLIAFGIALDDLRKSIGALADVEKLNETARALAYQANIAKQFGTEYSESAEALARFNIAKDRLEGTKIGNQILKASQDADTFKRSIEVTREIERFNEDIDSAIARVKELDKLGDIDPFGRNRERIDQALKGRFKAATPDEQKDLRSKAERADLEDRKLALREFAAEQARANEEIDFQSSLLGKSRDEQEQLTASRRIDLELQRLSVGASEEQRNAIEAQGEALKNAQKGSLQVQQDLAKSFQVGWNDAFNAYVDKATDASEQARTLFQAATDEISGGLFHVLQGDFTNIGDEFKRVVDRMVADWLTAQAAIGAQKLFPDFFNNLGSPSGFGNLFGSNQTTAVEGGTNLFAGAQAGGSAAADAALTSLAATATTADASFLTLSSSLVGLEGAFTGITFGTEAAGTSLSTLIGPITAAETAIATLAASTTAAAAQIAAAGAATTALLAVAKGGVFSGGNLVPFATGGVVNKPTFFPMRDGKTGLMGEAGPEAVMPLKRGKGGKLGVRVIGKKGEEDTLPLARDSSGRLAVKTFAKGAVFDDDVVPFAAGGVFHQGNAVKLASGGVLDITDAIMSPKSKGTTEISQQSGGPVIYLNISTPDVNSFRRSKNLMLNELNAAMSNAARRL